MTIYQVRTDAEPSKTFQPSKYQARVFEWVAVGRGDGIVNAVAGSGKTTTLVQAAQLVRGNALFIAFNKSIADELGRRLAGTTMAAKTIHAVGFACLTKALGRGVKVEDRKYYRIVAEYVDELADEWQRSDDDSLPTRSEAVSGLLKVADKARVTLTNPTDERALDCLCVKYGIDIHPRLLRGVGAVIRRGEAQARSRREIDYTDMLYLPYAWSLQAATYDWVFCDECQDLSAAQLDLVLKCRARGGRMLFVGDPRQAIYGFAGADAESFHRIKEMTQATELPLSICYRCPTSHLALAREIVPEIEARPDAPEGVIEQVPAGKLTEALREGDLVICRLTAPLISLCIRLIAQRVPARVRGRDIGKQLTEMVRAVQKLDGFRFEELPIYLKRYRTIQLDRLAKRDASESAVQSLNDRVDGIQACYDGFSAESVDALCFEIESLFADGRASIWLSTVHRAKGLEEQRVFILQPDKLPFRFAKQQPWEMEQEMNLKYVALTRAKGELYFVTDKAPAVPATSTEGSAEAETESPIEVEA